MSENIRNDDALLEIEKLKQQLKSCEKECDDLKLQLMSSNEILEVERAEHIQTVKALEMAQLIVDRSPVVLFRRHAEGDKTLEFISENLRQFGYSPDLFFSGEMVFGDILHPEDIDRLTDEIKAYADADVEEYTMQYRIVTKAGEVRWVEDQTSVVRNAAGDKVSNQGIFFDITERKNVERKLQKSEEKFRRIVETAGEGFLLMDENFNIIDVNNAYSRLLGYSREELLSMKSLDLFTDTSRLYIEANREKLIASEYREVETVVKAKDGQLIPLLVHGNTLRDDNGNIIGNMAFVTDMTEHKKALELAGEVQKSLLPTEKPDINGFDIAGRNVSCDEIGGDYYDYIWRYGRHNTSLSVVVGDISGHGVDSALFMTTARAFLRMRASQPGTGSEIVSEMNNHLALDLFDTGKFMTLFYLTIDTENNWMNWIRAGHDPALVYCPERDLFEELKGEGIALGFEGGFRYQEYRTDRLYKGQIITIGTDGVWEAFSKEGEMFGKERLRNVIRENATLSSQEIIDKVYLELDCFTYGTKAEDDITLVIIKVGELNA